MNKRLNIFIVILLMATSILLAGEEGAGTHHFNWGHFLGKVLNSLLLFGSLIYFLRKPLINLLAQKSLEVKSDILERERTLETTRHELQKMKDRLEKIEHEISGMKENANNDGNIEKLRLEELGQKEAQRINDITREEIDTRINNAVRSLKSRVADLTIEHFKKDIQAHLDPQTHEKIIQKNIKTCGEIIERE